MKKKILAILIGALMVLTMLPIGGLAAKEVTVTPKAGEYFLKAERTLANGELTIATMSFTPDNGVEYKISADGYVPKGTTASFGIILVESANRESVKLGAGISFSAATNGWETKEVTFTGDGNPYVFRFGFSKASSTGVVFLDNLKLVKVSEPETNLVPNGDFEAEFISTNVTANSESVPFELPGAGLGYYKGANSAPINGAFSRVDSVTVSVPDNTPIFAEDFQTITSEVANNPSGGYNTRTSRGSVEVVADPVAANATNKVLKVNNGNVGNPVASFVPMANPDQTKTFDNYADGNTFKLTFRAYIPAQDYTSGEETKNTATDGFSFGVTYKDGGLRYSTANTACTGAETGKWLNFEAYLSAFQTSGESQTLHLRAYASFAGYFYIDDVVLEKIDGNGYVSTMNAEACAENIRSAANGGTWACCYRGTYDNTVSATGKVRPVIAYAPANTTSKALAATAVYKKEEGGALTLVDINFEDVGRVARTSLTEVNGAGLVANAGEVGISGNNIAVDLAALELGAGEYEVQTFLWNYAALAPISNVTTFSVTVAS